MLCKRCHNEFNQEYEACQSCDGTGFVGYHNDTCHDCLGVGAISAYDELCPSCENIMKEILVK